MDSTDRDIAALTRHPLAWIALAILLLALLAVAALGGFRKAQSRQLLPKIAQGQERSNGAYRLTPVCAWIGERMPGRGYGEPGVRYLVLRMRAVNLMDSARPGLEQDVVWVPQGAGEGKKADAVTRADDQSLQVDPQPRLPITVDFIWKLSARIPVTQPVTWGVFARAYQAKGYISGEGGWMQGDPGFKIVMPAGTTCVERRR